MKKTIQITFYFSSIFMFWSCSNQLPDDITLNAPTQDASGIQLSWSQSTDEDFNSYKLYRHTSSGIDNSTGELIHVATSTTDVTFTDNTFVPQETYYYRLYVLSDNGISNGSNIESITSETISLVTNGSFESGVAVPSDWTVIQNNLSQPLNSITIDATTASDGVQSLKFNHAESTGCWEMWIYQYVSLADITPGGTYEFSFDYKSDAMISTSGIGFRLENNLMSIELPLPTFPGDGVWHSFAAQFVVPTDIGSTDPKMDVHFCNMGVVAWWIDNVSVVKV